jgi:FAD/FMN-containing dehydrogenase
MSLSDDEVFDALVRILGPSGVIVQSADTRYTRDWSGDNVGAPRLIVRPSSTEQVSRVMTLAAAHDLVVVPQGGNTGLVAGGIPSDAGDEIVLSLELMNEIGVLDAQNYSLAVQAGCVVETVRAHVASHGFLFPLALGSQGSCQVGGTIATNAGGLNVLRYGMMRDLVLGLEVVLPDGCIWNGMKALRKDNAGYDLKQYFIGSEGTLGIVTGAVLKLFPSPTQVETALIALGSLSAVVALYGGARRELSDLLSAFELLTMDCIAYSGQANPLADEAPFYVLLEASASGLVPLGNLVERFLSGLLEAGGIENAVIASSGAQASSFWKIREQMIEAQLRQGRHLRTDVSVPISSIEAFISGASRLIAEISPDVVVLAYGHVGDGNFHFNVVPPGGMDESAKISVLHQCEEAIFEEVDRVNGSISAEHGIGRIKRDAFLARVSQDHRRILEHVKRAFDPGWLLSPGRILEHPP